MNKNFLMPGFVPGTSSAKPTKTLKKQTQSDAQNRFENRKVPLGEGKSINDWIRLANSGKDLAGTGGNILKVTDEDMKKHSSRDDTWVILNGRVFNVTSYLEFHPGGVDEIMRAAGTDATELFNEIHPWVAWDSMLKNCFVGNFVGRKENLRLPDPPVADIGGLTVTDGSKLSGSNYYQCKIAAIQKITHDTNFYILEPPEDFKNVSLPIGCHVYFKMPIEGVNVTRPYTVAAERICNKKSEDQTKFCFIIKLYSSGLFTKGFKTLKEGDSIEVSDVFSPFSIKNLNSSTKAVLLFAAGSGITPMIRIINEILHFDKNIDLFFFNKTKRDIIWDEMFSKTAKEHSTFKFTNILSEPDSNWNGPTGRINDNLIKSLVKNVNFQISYVCVCGPVGFNEETLK